jgi:catechol 2,3-dioxygenase-like lactoylglutathione lyase family enzyme
LFSVGLREIVLIVDDVEVATRFYIDVVGLEIASESPDWTWFYAGDADRRQFVALHKGRLLFERQAAAPGGERWGPVHYAFRVPPSKLEEAAEHVRSRGVEVFGPVELEMGWLPEGDANLGENALAYYFYDPDDNLLEFYAYPDE